MNIRLQKYKKNRLLGMNQVNAAIAAGYPESTARHKSTSLENQAKIGDILERIGLTDIFLANKHLQLIEAHTLREEKDDKGKVLRVVRVEDFNIQMKALELAFNLKNHIKKQVEHSGKVEGDNRTIIIYPPDWRPKEERIEDNTKTISSRLPAF